MELRRKGFDGSKKLSIHKCSSYRLLSQMETEKGFWCRCSVLWLSLLLTEGVLSSEHANKSCTSSCGIITNISYPFRLRDDPPYCGHHGYELACENNITLLHLNDSSDGKDGRYRVIGRDEVLGTYRVMGINYNNYTIRLVDPGIQKGNCSSLPLYSLSRSNFDSYLDLEDSSNPYIITWLTKYLREYIKLTKQVGYLNCSNPVRDDTAYVDTAPCVNWESKGGGHLYAVAGDLLAHQFKPQCRLKWVTLTAQDWKSLLPGGIKSYTDIHTLLSSGFEISWLPRVCADLNCLNRTYCGFSPESQSLQCVHWTDLPQCSSPLGIYFSTCRKLPTLRIFAEDFAHGVIEGLNRIVNMYVDDHTFYDFGPSKVLIKLGNVIGRFLFPYIAMRFLLGVIFLFILLIYTWRRRHLSMYEDIEDFIRLHDLIPIRYSYKELKAMTEDFKNKLGEGGFGTVYKGKLRSGLDVAIKMLGKSKGNGQEFISEVATIGRIHHFNVVHLVGFCVEGTKRALVYEFMPNGSLDKYIFSKGSISLSYHKIHEISLGIAHGIAYLHHGCDMQILHFDIKPHNILLDENFNPKISDFGLARLYSIDDSIVTLTAARGTIGYMAPELFYKNIGGVSYKADVYSFGMLLMEMASQRRNLNPHVEHSSQLYFPLWVYDQFDEEKDIEMEDFSEEDKDLAKKMFIVALWCIQLKPADRPSMGKVIEMLEADDVESLEMPPKPSLYPNEEVLVDGSSSSHATSTISLHSHSCQGECIS
ncbi:hypothetical protein QN277_007746 [Acacia crassicarpa]|uniref:Protein kinase domain-containing protein n=1 Tax=Acacia crassicarpa TaxID=499986 RepID=A0AAE1IV30_9FABA|nr:hypothetical protein QN277_007746 [Acacia crassicarpa]